MRRRDFITVLGGAAAVWPATSRPQPSTKVARIGVLYIGLADADSFKKELRQGLREIAHTMVRGPDEELEPAFAAIIKNRADALVIQRSSSTKRVADLTLEHRLPAASSTRGFVDAGGLMSYGADGPILFRHSAKFVHRILQGKQPGELPIEQPTKFELAINLKTAKAIGLAIPEAFLLRADSLLE
jgi:ABC-type uncharacterized transport system substrate-binding protein